MLPSAVHLRHGARCCSIVNAAVKSIKQTSWMPRTLAGSRTELQLLHLLKRSQRCRAICSSSAAAETASTSNAPAAVGEVSVGAAPDRVERSEGQDPTSASTHAQAAVEPKKKGEAQPAKKEVIATVDMLDIRVGQIVSVGRHPDADSLYVEEIDIGEEQPRQIVSGLVKFVPEEEMQGRRVLVLANLKPAKLRGVLSSGMVLCASNQAHDKVEPVLVPDGVEVGERVTFEGLSGAPEPVLNPKKKLWEKIAPDLHTNAEGVAVYKDIPFMTSKGPITSSLPNAVVR